MPATLEVPAGHVVFLEGQAVGTQNYICIAAATGVAWKFLGPQATLFLSKHGDLAPWRTIQTVIDAGYVDGFKVLHPEEPGMTLPTTDPHVRLDYVFVPQPDAGRVIACDVVRDPVAVGASDHFPVVADFTVDD